MKLIQLLVITSMIAGCNMSNKDASMQPNSAKDVKEVHYQYPQEKTEPVGKYVLGPLSQAVPGVPCGSLTKYTMTSRIYAGTVRDYWVYVPAQYDAAKPACVMVFQDGSDYITEFVRVPTVMDNLIHMKKMPVTIAIFVNSGKDPNAAPIEGHLNSERSIEYDTLSGRYASFLMEEILPEAAKKYNLRNDAEGRAICGYSSGGICAFTVAWERPDAFSKVLSHIGSYIDIRGGHVYPTLIRKSPKKPIRVFLQDGSNDRDIEWGCLPLANQEMAAALRFKGYDYKFVYGTGAHSLEHGAAIMPEALEWLWR